MCGKAHCSRGEPTQECLRQTASGGLAVPGASCNHNAVIEQSDHIGESWANSDKFHDIVRNMLMGVW